MGKEMENKKVQEMLASLCIVNGEVVKLDDLQSWGYQDFIDFMQQRIPDRLYKYFPNTIEEDNKNYSLEAVRDNTVHLSYPSVFDDIYDSDISISFEQFERLRLMEYCRRCNIPGFEKADGQRSSQSLSTEEIANMLIDKLNAQENFLDAFDSENCTDIQNLANELFCHRLNVAVDTDSSLYNVMQLEYKKCLEDLKNTFKTTCFAKSPYSQLMWGGIYANCHRGFCLEYKISKDPKYKAIYENLFPLVYSKARSNIEKDFINQLDTFPTTETLKNIYIHGALRKSIDWAFQDEWRLLLIDGMPGMKESKVNFFPISKVYLGYRMEDKERKKIIKICEKKGIEYVGVRKRQDIFEMEECPIN